MMKMTVGIIALLSLTQVLAQEIESESFRRQAMQLCREHGGKYTTENDTYPKEQISNSKFAIKWCRDIGCLARDAVNRDDGAAVVAWHRNKCIDLRTVDLDAETDGEYNTDGGLSFRVIVRKCLGAGCPDGYRYDPQTNTITRISDGHVWDLDGGPGGTTQDQEGTWDGGVEVDEGCPSSGCWFDGRRVTAQTLFNKCFIITKKKKIGKFLWIKKKNTGKWRIWYEVRPECAGYYAKGKMVVDGNARIEIGGSCPQQRPGGGSSSKQTISCRDARANCYDEDTTADADDILYIEEAPRVRVTAGGSGGWVWVNDTRKCEYSTSWMIECVENYNDIIRSASGEILHCIKCDNKRGQGSAGVYIDGGLGAYGNSTGGIISAVGGAVGALANPLFGYLGARKYAGAMEYQARMCKELGLGWQAQAHEYIQFNELPDRDIQAPNCNGYNMGAFAGGGAMFGGQFGGIGNPMFSAGFTPGFAGGMAGPYGMYNPYGQVNGGINLNLGGGVAGLGGLGGIGQLGGIGGLYGAYPGTPGINGGAGWPGGINGGIYGNGGMYSGVNAGGLGLVPWANGGAHGQYGAQTQYWQNMQASQIGAQYQNQALYRNAQDATSQYYNWQRQNQRGYNPWSSPTNMGANFNFGAYLGY